ncbi:hypothetical protein [Adhaeretor mobilis]|uniref:Uncharacterized protein n=1 Tax=Adhaeretor mobilis TaxID=1930276 RepID=A0A517N2Q0_9BACT|nr:hypothetical protein [Adhaeretor mobilis]QDT01416.1 hypothetical protein HG15A2_47580 [Adhaeretor mobilis]
MQRNLFAPVLSGVALLGLLAADSLTWAAHPETPCACAADGNCRPKRDTWGVWHTHWRPWPGDPAAVPPTTADPQYSEDEEAGLKGIERPIPSKEDKAGPEKQEREEDDATVEALGDPLSPEGGGAEALPELEPLGLRSPAAEGSFPRIPKSALGLRNPAFQNRANPIYGSAPQPLPNVSSQLANPAARFTPLEKQIKDDGVRPASHLSPVQQTQPNGENAPPSLPTSLRRVAHLTGLLKPLPPVTPPQNVPASRLRIRTDNAVMPTSANAVSTDNGGIRIINPASAYAAEPGKGGLQQAIYFEGSEE